ncbi:hypothetical protein FHL15_002554 [Xylaria flabelliformis]|uniref:Uncharacterized protein n=1 Tax=Xylaria flabelliformis TaxID=2512241 RepID=A0A553I8Y9_9PEZI|nr:hypothetical protein FHL15_002554 [Xylaria flabelliformis]
MQETLGYAMRNYYRNTLSERFQLARGPQPEKVIDNNSSHIRQPASRCGGVHVMNSLPSKFYAGRVELEGVTCSRLAEKSQMPDLIVTPMASVVRSAIIMGSKVNGLAAESAALVDQRLVLLDSHDDN